MQLYKEKLVSEDSNWKMDILTSMCVSGLRIVRNSVDVVSTFAFNWYYDGKCEELPPIKSPYLLEPANVLARKIRRREVTSTEVVKAFIERIRDVQPIVNAMVEVRYNEALEDARYVDEVLASTTKSEEEIAEETPFLGVPVSIKEAIALKGCLFTVGLPARKAVRANIDGDAVKLLKKAGAIPLGVTITPELCFWWESYNTLYGRCSNPYDTTRTSGGSSGGEGCILGAAGSVIGVGNDIGGSIRIPASFNGIFGHKPSRGVVSNQGQYPTAAPQLQTYLMTGPMCRYATDLLPLLKVLAVDQRKKLRLDKKVDLSDLKIYYMENDGGNPLVSSVHREITRAQHKVLNYFEEKYGIKAVKVKVPHMEESFELWSKIITTSEMKPITYEMTGRTGHANLKTELFKWTIRTSDHILPVIISAIMNKFLTPKEEKEAAVYYEKLHNMENYFSKILDDDSIFIFPTGPDYALHHGHALLKPFNVSYTGIFNLLGYPVTQCPIVRSKDGLPIGLQIVSNLYNDHITIAVAEEIEKKFGGWIDPSGR